jgi:predicted membrane protein
LYSLSKIVAALLVLASMIDAFNLGAFLIQVGFIFFGLVGMFRRGETLRSTVSDRRELDRGLARFPATEAS